MTRMKYPGFNPKSPTLEALRNNYIKERVNAKTKKGYKNLYTLRSAHVATLASPVH